MPIKEISENKFYSYNVQKSPMASMIGEEVEWFQDEENNLLGTVIQDKIDKDWGYVLMAKESDGKFRAIEVNASLESTDAAETELLNKMAELAHSGEFKEELYKEPTPISEIDEPTTITITNIDEEVKNYLKKHPEKLYDLSPRKFEELVASILEDLGFDVKLTQETRDGGTDIIARIKNSVTSFLVLVECKKYSPENKVGVGIIRQVAGVHSLREPSKSIIVTTSFFTEDAQKWASQYKEKLELKDYNNLKEWLKKY
jgi:HJR/Mrr/RecB family endonuclease